MRSNKQDTEKMGHPIQILENEWSKKHLCTDPNLPKSHQKLDLSHLHLALKEHSSSIAKTVKAAWLLRAEEVKNASPYESHFGGRKFTIRSQTPFFFQSLK